MKDQVTKKEELPFNFAFEIGLPDRQFLLFVETEIEVMRWIRVLKIFVIMNLSQVSLSGIHPFDFEQQQQLEKVEKNQTIPVVKQGQLP